MTISKWRRSEGFLELANQLGPGWQKRAWGWDEAKQTRHNRVAEFA